METYKIQIDRDSCVGDKLCSEVALATFEIDDEGKAVVRALEGDPTEDVLSAARNCRLYAITLHDAATGQRVWPPA